MRNRDLAKRAVVRSGRRTAGLSLGLLLFSGTCLWLLLRPMSPAHADTRHAPLLTEPTFATRRPLRLPKCSTSFAPRVVTASANRSANPPASTPKANTKPTSQGCGGSGDSVAACSPCSPGCVGCREAPESLSSNFSRTCWRNHRWTTDLRSMVTACAIDLGVCHQRPFTRESATPAPPALFGNSPMVSLAVGAARFR